MGRTPNPTKTVTFTVSTTPMVKAYLESLVGRGVFGKNVAEVAERLICEKLRDIEGKSDYDQLFAQVRTRESNES